MKIRYTTIINMPRTILVSGASSGLGFAFVKAFAQKSSDTIIACDKDPFPRERLQETSSGKQAEIQSHIVDVTSESSIQNLSTSLADTTIDLVLHSAGIRGLVPEVENAQPNDVAACETLPVMNLDTLMRTFHINAAGTFMLLRALLPNLKRASDAKVVVMSSRMGSVGRNVAGSAYAYRASKAALNIMVKSMSIDVPQVAFILCHPGRVETNLVRSREEGAITADESVSGLLPLIAKWDKDDSGKFYDRFGDPIEW